jgi:CRISPR/Cas system endoribonuclease Cas6 (RAMP superfamily)
VRDLQESSTLTGSAELMEIAWTCGLGEKNGSGMGMIEVKG